MTFALVSRSPSPRLGWKLPGAVSTCSLSKGGYPRAIRVWLAGLRQAQPERGFWLTVAALFSCLATSALAQPVTSPGPDSVSIAIYADPDRNAATKPNLGWLRGYALISEKRTITIPAGRATIRFEGVAGGILPESAIVTGLPDGVREKNLDADLLSPRSLYAHSIGRPVTIRRTLGGKTVEEPAIIRSGPDGAAVLQTRDGIIAADCEGRDSLIYDAVPEGLSAKPTLSVQTDAAESRQVTVTLSYLAWGFDWQANYVATMRPDGRSADLFAGVTLANGDVTSFADADTMVVAGRVNREGAAAQPHRFGGGGSFEFQCMASVVYEQQDKYASAPMAMAMAPAPEPVMVTGMRVSRNSNTPVTVVREALGDLQFYRVPHPTTVAAQSQKQIALLDREAVPVDVIYRSDVNGDYVGNPVLTLRAQNREAKGLGLPLPRGKVAVFEPRGDTSLLIGEGSIGDKAVGEEVEVDVAQATQVRARVVKQARGKGGADYTLTVTNANPFPVRFEAVIGAYDGVSISKPSVRLGRKNGSPFWAVEVPANGMASLRYRVGSR